jgi:predicted RNase H-like HicB family nuclease
MKQIHAVVWKEDKWFVAKALEVEVTSQGRTQEEGLKNLKEALELYFEEQDDVALTDINNPTLQSLTI